MSTLYVCSILPQYQMQANLRICFFVKRIAYTTLFTFATKAMLSKYTTLITFAILSNRMQFRHLLTVASTVNIAFTVVFTSMQFYVNIEGHNTFTMDSKTKAKTAFTGFAP